jgi:hypothetical protein
MGGRQMVYRFDPTWFNGTIFRLADYEMGEDWMDFKIENRPIPASHFPRSLIVERAKGPLPDLFHASRGIIVVSEQARAIFDKRAPGQVEFIPVDIEKARTGWLNPLLDAYYSMREFGRAVLASFAPDRATFYPVGVEARQRISLRLNYRRSYYFINVLGRAQRLLWLESPTSEYPAREDGTVRVGLENDFEQWKLRWRTASEPLIWHDTPWIVDNKRYSHQSEVFIEDALWQELDSKFPGQLNAQRVGGERS